MTTTFATPAAPGSELLAIERTLRELLEHGEAQSASIAESIELLEAAHENAVFGSRWKSEWKWRLTNQQFFLELAREREHSLRDRLTDYHVGLTP